MESAITAIGTATPAFKRSQQEIVEFLSTALNLKSSEKRLLTAIYKATGIAYRYSVLSDHLDVPGGAKLFPQNPEDPLPSTAVRLQIYKEHALALAVCAVEKCFATVAHFDPASITHIITVSCTGMYAPGIDIEIAQHFSLSASIKRTCINFMGCYGAFNALKAADSFCKAEPDAKVLIVGVELCSIHFQKSNHKDHIISNAIFADGAAAVLIEAAPRLQKCFLIRDFYCDLLPHSQKEMAWCIADSGFDIVLSAYVPAVIESGIAHFTQKLLGKYNMQFSDVDFFAIHPGGIKILEACESALKISPEHNKYAYQVLRDYGNMSSVTVLFVLQTLWQDIDVEQHDKTIFSCAFGPGLTLESMLLKTQTVCGTA